MVSFCIGTISVSALMYYFIRHLEASNEIYRKMKEEAKVDFLTGLNNVRQFDILLNTALNNAKIRVESLSLLFIDIDYFKKVKITVSIGVSSYPQTTADVEKLVEQPDIALYNAKRAGRNRVTSA